VTSVARVRLEVRGAAGISSPLSFRLSGPEGVARVPRSSWGLGGPLLCMHIFDTVQA
jgi:hypothetical protein